jgi:hypothetical protein
MNEPKEFPIKRSFIEETFPVKEVSEEYARAVVSYLAIGFDRVVFFVNSFAHSRLILKLLHLPW